MTMYYLKHGNDVANTIQADSPTAAWRYFAAVKSLTIEKLKEMGYTVTKRERNQD